MWDDQMHLDTSQVNGCIEFNVVLEISCFVTFICYIFWLWMFPVCLQTCFVGGMTVLLFMPFVTSTQSYLLTILNIVINVRGANTTTSVREPKHCLQFYFIYWSTVFQKNITYKIWLINWLHTFKIRIFCESIIYT